MTAYGRIIQTVFNKFKLHFTKKILFFYFLFCKMSYYNLIFYWCFIRNENESCTSTDNSLIILTIKVKYSLYSTGEILSIYSTGEILVKYSTLRSVGYIIHLTKLKLAPGRKCVKHYIFSQITSVILLKTVNTCKHGQRI